MLQRLVIVVVWVVAAVMASAAGVARAAEDLHDPLVWARAFERLSDETPDLLDKLDYADTAADIYVLCGTREDLRRLAEKMKRHGPLEPSYTSVRVLTLGGFGQEAMKLAARDTEGQGLYQQISYAAALVEDHATRQAAAAKALAADGDPATIMADHLLANDVEAAAEAGKHLETDLDQADAMSTFASVLSYVGRFEEAARWEQQAAALQAAAEAAGIGEEERFLLDYVLYNRVTVLLEARQPDAARPLIDRIEDPYCKADLTAHLWGALRRAGRDEEANAARQALAMQLMRNDMMYDDVAYTMAYANAHDPKHLQTVFATLTPDDIEWTVATGTAYGVLADALWKQAQGE